MAEGWDAIADSTKTIPGSIQDAKGVGARRLTEQEVENWLFTSPQPSNFLFCGIYGWDGTAKTGLAMDCRSELEIADGKKVIILDLDGGSAPLKTTYHASDDNIVIKNPIQMQLDGTVDYEATFQQIKQVANLIAKNKDKYNIACVILDGLDKLLKICEYSMRDELGIGVEDGVSIRYWNNRNKKYYDILEPLKMMGVNVYLITHLKSDQTGSNIQPLWQIKTPDMLYQKIECVKETYDEGSKGHVELWAVIRKCKTNLGLEGRKFLLAEVIHDPKTKTSESHWYGLQFRIVDGQTAVYQRNESSKWVMVK